ncbi:hypothetical protein E2C01_073318 [Portunus trituberculatus]|uniref:Uncharacterized protein n=1 Tax=Portunus trituberculatus TaxID=210409 RepID=A0A5B7I2I3_PORTR|nr:hypothetical protein [Portunus trituberculatus]
MAEVVHEMRAKGDEDTDCLCSVGCWESDGDDGNAGGGGDNGLRTCVLPTCHRDEAMDVMLGEAVLV